MSKIEYLQSVNQSNPSFLLTLFSQYSIIVVNSQLEQLFKTMENQVSEASIVDSNIAMKIIDIEKKFPSLLSQYQSFNRGNNPKDILIWMQKIKNIISYLKIHYQEFGILRERQISVFEDLAEFIASGKTEGTIKPPPTKVGGFSF